MFLPLGGRLCPHRNRSPPPTLRGPPTRVSMRGLKGSMEVEGGLRFWVVRLTVCMFVFLPPPPHRRDAAKPA